MIIHTVNRLNHRGGLSTWLDEVSIVLRHFVFVDVRFLFEGVVALVADIEFAFEEGSLVVELGGEAWSGVIVIVLNH